jgi:hypothetical protein
MLTAELIIRSFGALVVLLAFCILIGNGFLRIFRRISFSNPFERLYWAGLAGLVLTVSFYAIYVTGFQTVLLICPVLMGLFVFLKPSGHTQTAVGITKKQLLFMGLALVLYFTFFATAFYNVSKPGFIKFAALDNLYYARLAGYLNVTGREISTPEYLFPQAFSTMPYHYGDLWLVSLISNFTNLKPPFALFLVAYPFLSVLSVLGIAGFVTHRFVIPSNWIFVILPALFFYGITFLYPVWLGDGFGPRPVANYPKTLWIAVLFIGTISLAAKKDWNSLFILASICCVTYINVLPAVTVSMVLMALLCVFVFHKPLKAMLPGLAIAGFTLIYIYSFYKLTATSQTASLGLTNGPETLLESLKDPVGALKVIYLPILQVRWFLPFILLFFWVCFKRRMAIKNVLLVLLSPECIWFSLLLGSGLLAWMLTRFYTIEAPQFYYNIFLPLVSLSIAVWAYWILSLKVNALIKSIVIGILCYLIVCNRDYTYDVNYRPSNEWSSLSHFLEGEESPVFLNLKAAHEFPGVFQKNTRLFQPLPEINYLLNPYINESLNIPYLLQDSMNITAPTVRMLLHNTSMYQYMKTQQLAPQRAGEELMQEFAKEVNARYLVVSKQTSIPTVFRASVADSLQLTDWVVYKLRLNLIEEE